MEIEMERIEDNAEAWEERRLGSDPDFATRLDADTWLKEQQEIDDAIGLKAISIRLETDLIEEFKMIAKYNNMGYQPLMRQALHQFAKCELKKMAADALATQEEAVAQIKAERKAA
jgi:predicted transcriptional regulator